MMLTILALIFATTAPHT